MSIYLVGKEGKVPPEGWKIKKWEQQHDHNRWPKPDKYAVKCEYAYKDAGDIEENKWRKLKKEVEKAIADSVEVQESGTERDSITEIEFEKGKIKLNRDEGLVKVRIGNDDEKLKGKKTKNLLVGIEGGLERLAEEDWWN